MGARFYPKVGQVAAAQASRHHCPDLRARPSSFLRPIGGSSGPGRQPALRFVHGFGVLYRSGVLCARVYMHTCVGVRGCVGLCRMPRLTCRRLATTAWRQGMHGATGPPSPCAAGQARSSRRPTRQVLYPAGRTGAGERRNALPLCDLAYEARSRPRRTVAAAVHAWAARCGIHPDLYRNAQQSSCPGRARHATTIASCPRSRPHMHACMHGCRPRGVLRAARR